MMSLQIKNINKEKWSKKESYGNSGIENYHK